MHKSGFVNIVGRPNVGKSTLMNALVGERMSIITNKPQTTRHRIIGIVNEADYQVVFSDTPGIISEPSYKMHEAMNRFVEGSLKDADLILFMTDMTETYAEDDPIFDKLRKVKVPVFLLINKTDLAKPQDIAQFLLAWNKRFTFNEIFPISALKKRNTKQLFDFILKNMPEGPVYYPKDQLTDKPERFFVSEIIREKILLHYQQEIPYSCEVVVDTFKEDEIKPLVRIHATIYVMRKTQKSIIIGNKGESIKRIGTEARKDIETFIDKKVFLELFVKVRDNWRNDEKSLKRFGYNH